MNVSVIRQFLMIVPFGYGLVSLYLIYLGISQQSLPVENETVACVICAAYCGIACAMSLAISRHSLFSFPGAFLGISSLYMIGLMITYPIHQDHVFATWYIVE